MLNSRFYCLFFCHFRASNPSTPATRKHPNGCFFRVSGVDDLYENHCSPDFDLLSLTDKGSVAKADEYPSTIFFAIYKVKSHYLKKFAICFILCYNHRKKIITLKEWKMDREKWNKIV